MTHNSQLTVRAMTLDDLDQVLAIDRASFTLPWPMSAYRYELLDNNAALCQVVEIQPPDEADGLPNKPAVIAGMIVIWLILDEAHIATIATHPDHRREGIARVLLARSLEDCVRKGARTALLEVREGNLEAQNLYHRFGFEIAGRRPRYYRDNQEDALLMTVYGIDSEGYARQLHAYGNVNYPSTEQA
jgi:[ribosomal protein S18]-alanine N-acetyltransferase